MENNRAADTNFCSKNRTAIVFKQCKKRNTLWYVHIHNNTHNATPHNTTQHNTIGITAHSAMCTFCGEW